MNAYCEPRWLAPGCDHRGPYCHCQAPIWLRQPTPEERAFEARMALLPPFGRGEPPAGTDEQVEPRAGSLPGDLQG